MIILFASSLLGTGQETSPEAVPLCKGAETERGKIQSEAFGVASITNSFSIIITGLSFSLPETVNLGIKNASKPNNNRKINHNNFRLI